MSKNGVYSPFKAIRDEPDYGVRVTDRYSLGKHARDFIQDPVVSMFEEDGSDEMLLFGWSFEPDEEYMYSSHHSWAISKLYHTYGDGSNFTNFWTTISNYCEPLRCLYHIRHGEDFPNMCEVTYGAYEMDLYEVFTDGSGGYCLVNRPVGDAKFEDIDVIEKHNFDLNIREQFL